jgi:hypothetical protein
MRRSLAVIVLSLMVVSTALAQSYPETDALIDALYAKDLKGVLAHLPIEVGKALQDLPERDRLQMTRILPLINIAYREGLKVTRNDGSGAVLTVEKQKRPGETDDSNVTIHVFVEKRLTDGTESLLRLRVKIDDTAIKEDDKLLALNMRYLDGEWRLYEVQADREVIKLDGPEFLSSLHVSSAPTREAAAVGSMRTFNTAMVTYASTYPERGFPRSLEQLGGQGNSADHAGLLDESLTTPPFEKSGYRFTYQPDGNASYAVVARPAKYEEGTKKSFFTDQSGVIRYTEEDREPTAADPPLE